MDRKAHWESVYDTKRDEELSWHQPDPALSVELIGAASGGRGRVIDVGGGSSSLVDHLLDMRFDKVAVLDISAAALARARTRLGERAGGVEWIEADVTQADDVGRFDVWHDRAVFHFLTDPSQRGHYS
jgi:trans-aconitate methyltransferase